MLIAPSGQDPFDRVRPFRSAANCERRGLSKPENLQVPGLHLHLRQLAQRRLPLEAQEPRRPHAGEAEGDQRKACESAGRTAVSTRAMAWPGGPRLVQLPRRAHQLSRAQCVPMLSTSGDARSGGVARRTSRHGKGSKAPAREWLPPPKILHPWPPDRFRVKHPRWGAVCGNPARTDLERGAFSNGRPYRDRTSDLRSAGTRALHSALASGSAGLTVEGAPLDRALDRRCLRPECANRGHSDTALSRLRRGRGHLL